MPVKPFRFMLRRFSDVFCGRERDTALVERFRCAACGNVLTVPVRLVALPVGPHWSLLDHHHVNPPRLEPGTYAVDEAAYGRDRVVGSFVLSPGDVSGTRFVHDLVLIGCWSLVGWEPCVACDRCGELVASRTDDCHVAQETRFYPSVVVRDACGDPEVMADPFALVADWDEAAPDTRKVGWVPAPTRPRPELVATRWRGWGVKAQLFRDDPPAWGHHLSCVHDTPTIWALSDLLLLVCCGVSLGQRSYREARLCFHGWSCLNVSAVIGARIRWCRSGS